MLPLHLPSSQQYSTSLERSLSEPRGSREQAQDAVPWRRRFASRRLTGENPRAMGVTSASALPSPLSQPTTGSTSPQVPYQPSPRPLAFTSNVPYNASPLHQTNWAANGNGSGSNSRETSLRAQSKLRGSRKEWTPTLKPHSFPKAQLRGTREGEPKCIPGYSICDLPEQDLDRMKDYVLSYVGSDWPDFSENLTKADIQSSRKARWEAKGEARRTAITAVRFEEVKQLESSFAKTDLPKAGEQLTEQERVAMESNLVELGQVRKWYNDDALLKMLRVRELNTINPPSTTSSSTSSSQTSALFPHALLGVIKTTRLSSSHLNSNSQAPSSSLDLDLPSRCPPPRFNFTPPPPHLSLVRKDWKGGFPPPPKSSKDFKDGTWDDGSGGTLRAEIWDFLKATNSDAGSEKVQNYKTKFDAIGYLDTFFHWHEDDKDFDRWATLDKTTIHLNQGPAEANIAVLARTKDPRLHPPQHQQQQQQGPYGGF